MIMDSRKLGEINNGEYLNTPPYSLRIVIKVKNKQILNPG